jgi:hypothetical protein
MRGTDGDQVSNESTRKTKAVESFVAASTLVSNPVALTRRSKRDRSLELSQRLVSFRTEMFPSAAFFVMYPAPQCYGEIPKQISPPLTPHHRQTLMECKSVILKATVSHQQTPSRCWTRLHITAVFCCVYIHRPAAIPSSKQFSPAASLSAKASHGHRTLAAGLYMTLGTLSLQSP